MNDRTKHRWLALIICSKSSALETTLILGLSPLLAVFCSGLSPSPGFYVGPRRKLGCHVSNDVLVSGLQHFLSLRPLVLAWKRWNGNNKCIYIRLSTNFNEVTLGSVHHSVKSHYYCTVFLLLHSCWLWNCAVQNGTCCLAFARRVYTSLSVLATSHFHNIYKFQTFSPCVFLSS